MKECAWRQPSNRNVDFTSLALFCEVLLELLKLDPSWTVICILSAKGAPEDLNFGKFAQN